MGGGEPVDLEPNWPCLVQGGTEMKSKVNVKLSLYLTKHHTMKTKSNSHLNWREKLLAVGWPLGDHLWETEEG
jgi:hypothetical protein